VKLDIVRDESGFSALEPYWDALLVKRGIIFAQRANYHCFPLKLNLIRERVGLAFTIL